MLVDMLLVLLVLVHDMFPLVFTLVLLLQPRSIFAFLLMVVLSFLREFLFWGMILRVLKILFTWTNICIMLTHLVSWVHPLPVWPSIGYQSMCLLTLWDPRLGLLCLLECRYGDMVGEHELDGTWSLAHEVIKIGWFSMPLWMALKSLCTDV
jgi:hypothetical protein